VSNSGAITLGDIADKLPMLEVACLDASGIAGLVAVVRLMEPGCCKIFSSSC